MSAVCVVARLVSLTGNHIHQHLKRWCNHLPGCGYKMVKYDSRGAFYNDLGEHTESNLV